MNVALNIAGVEKKNTLRKLVVAVKQVHGHLIRVLNESGASATVDIFVFLGW